MTQPRLPGTAGRRKVGQVERAASDDLRLLRDLGVIPAGMDALTVTYRRLAHQIDSAHDEADRYGVINSARELRQLRDSLGVTATPEDEDALQRVIDAIVAQLEHDPDTA